MQSGAARYRTSNLPILLRLKFQKHACLSFLEFGFDTYSVPKKTELSQRFHFNLSNGIFKIV